MDFKPSPRSGYQFNRADAVRGGILSGVARREKRDIRLLRRHQRDCEGRCPNCGEWIRAWLYVHPRRKPENRN